MRIAHISDIHIRTLKWHDEYNRTFENLYNKLRELKPDRIIDTGDTVHSKTNVSPELFGVVSNFLKNLSDIAPVDIILGNHDMNLMNHDRQDAITPIVEAINSDSIHLYKSSGRKNISPGVNLWVFSMADTKNYPTKSEILEYSNDINIGLFHGSVLNCVTDSNWRLRETESDMSLFEGLDYTLLGDIHKRQSFGNGSIAYPGSLIQQNFGEELEKGFLVWDIEDKKKFSTSFYPLTGSRKFYTIKLDDNLKFENIEVLEGIVAKGSRIRISPSRQLSTSEKNDVESKIKQKFQPSDVITLSAGNISSTISKVGNSKLAHEDLRTPENQEKLLNEYLSNKKINESVLENIKEINKRCHLEATKGEELVSRNVFWKLESICWDNLFNYGKNNILDFSRISGLTGIFAPNAAGKSNLIDVMLETLFDATTKGIPKNIFVINDNMEHAAAVANISTEEGNFVIERKIERIKFGGRQGQQKEWGKTSCEFYRVHDNGETQSLNGDLRPETERNIRRKLGSYEDFMLTSLSAQWNPLDIISCRETERKKILYKFLDLDIFEQKCQIAKEQYKDELKKQGDVNVGDLKKQMMIVQKEIFEIQTSINDRKSKKKEIEADVLRLTDDKVNLLSKKINVPNYGSENIEFLEKNRKLILSEVEVSTDRLTTASAKIGILRAELDKIVNPLESTESSLDTALKTLTSDKSKLDSLISDIKNEINNKIDSVNRISKSLKILQEVPCGDSFPSCKFLSGAVDDKKSLPDIDSSIIKLKQKLEVSELDRKALLEKMSSLEVTISGFRKISSLTKEISNLSLQIENEKLKVSSAKSKITDIDSKILKLSEFKESIIFNADIDKKLLDIQNLEHVNKKKIDLIQVEIDSIHRKAGGKQENVSNLSTSIKKIENAKDISSAYELYIDAMGKDGIALQILKQKLPLINLEISRILSLCADFDVHIEFDEEEQSVRLFIQYGDYKTRLLELGSGAEKFLSSLALRVALLNISNLPKTNMMIIDEGFGKLDPRNFEAVSRMFDYLRTVFEHVIVISHSEIMKDLVDSTIEIGSDETGYAHVSIGDIENMEENINVD